MSLRDMLPEQYRSPVYWDDEAAMRAFLDDVRTLAMEALDAARWIDAQFPGIHYAAKEVANDLHSAAEVVCPNICEEA